MSFFALAFLWRKSSWLFESWIFSSMLFRKVWLVDQSVHFHFQFLKGQSSFAPWRLHCQAKVKVKTKRGEKMNSSRWNTTQILEFFFSSIVIIHWIRGADDSESVCGLCKCRLATNYGDQVKTIHQLPAPAFQLLHIATSLQTVLPAFNYVSLSRSAPNPRTQNYQFVGNALSDSNEGSFQAVLGQGEKICYVMRKTLWVWLLLSQRDS